MIKSSHRAHFKFIYCGSWEYQRNLVGISMGSLGNQSLKKPCVVEISFMCVKRKIHWVYQLWTYLISLGSFKVHWGIIWVNWGYIVVKRRTRPIQLKTLLKQRTMSKKLQSIFSNNKKKYHKVLFQALGEFKKGNTRDKKKLT